MLLLRVGKGRRRAQNSKMRPIAVEARLDNFTRLPLGQDFPGPSLADDEPVVCAAGHEELAIETEPNGVNRLQGEVGDLSGQQGQSRS